MWTGKHSFNQLVKRDKNEAKIEVDLSEITDWGVANYNKRNSDDFTMEGREIFKIDDKRDLYITSFYVEFYQESKKISDLSVSGYVLGRDWGEKRAWRKHACNWH